VANIEEDNAWEEEEVATDLNEGSRRVIDGYDGKVAGLEMSCL
jgi:hypothetical protein